MSGTTQGQCSAKCMKHDKRWRCEVESVVNKLRDKTALLPQKYEKRFPGLLCCCRKLEQRPYMEDPWEEISEAQLHESLQYIDHYISDHIQDPVTAILQPLMKALRADGQVLANKPETEGNGACCSQDTGSSALKLVYLMYRLIEKDHTLFECKRRKISKTELPAHTTTFELTNFQEENVGRLIGRGGSNLIPFQKYHKCRVEVTKAQGKVMVTIERKCKDIEVLKKIRSELEEKAKEVTEDQQQYMKDQQQNMDAQ